MNRSKNYSENNRTNNQYKITIFPIDKGKTKDEQINVIKGLKDPKNLKKVNFAKKISQANAKEFLCDNILNISIFNDSSSSTKIGEVSHADFLFVDFEEPNKKSGKKVMTFETCLKILKKNNLNYILKTSFTHTSAKPRLHLFLSTLNSIKTDGQYKYNLKITLDKYFSEYYYDPAPKNINRWVFSSNSESLKFSYNFEDNDIEIEEVSEKLHSVYVESEDKSPVVINDKSLKDFNEQVYSMYGFLFNRIDSNGVIKYKRNDDDNVPNVWYSTSYYENADKYTIYDKSDKYNVLFSYKDFYNSKNLKNDQSTIQNRLQKELGNWFIEGDKNYVITNEGLGKSTSVLKYGRTYSFIYVCYSNDRIDEVSQQLESFGIKYKKILGNEILLKEIEKREEFSEIKELNLSAEYNVLINKKKIKNISFKNFIDMKVKNEKMKNAILKIHEENKISLTKDDCVRLITSSKLAIEIKKENYKAKDSSNWFNHQKIIFDEFIFSEWAEWRSPDEGEQSKSYETIWRKKDSYVNLCENELSFLKLLEYSKSNLILTTERSIIKPLFYKSQYEQMFFFSKDGVIKDLLDHIKFEKKLYDDNITYVLTRSTKKDNRRDKIIKGIKSWFKKKYNEKIEVISDGTKLRDASHIGVKGSNKYQDKDLLIIGTFRTEVEDNIFYYSCKEYFDEYSKRLSKKDINEKKEINNFIKSLHLQAQISQSICRNSGYRRSKNKETIVVLPILNENSKHNFKHFDLNYVSPKVLIELDFENIEHLIKKLP